jgi:A/G-specific adenine glycosylase
VSEIMLQQTQVARVLPKYKEWIKQFPTFRALSRAKLKDVLALWHGLGYNRRALCLKRTAEIVAARYKGMLPATREEMTALPGIGNYTAGAILAFAHNVPYPIIETNIRTVYIHLFFKDRDTIDTKNVREWYWALMDYGAMLKERYGNANIKSAHYKKQSQFKGSMRALRAAILREVTKKPLTAKEITALFPGEKERVHLSIDALRKEGFLLLSRNTLTIA